VGFPGTEKRIGNEVTLDVSIVEDGIGPRCQDAAMNLNPGNAERSGLKEVVKNQAVGK